MQIKSESEYESALKRIDELWGADPGTSEGSELEALFNAVEEYEDEHYPVDEPKSYAAIQFHLERLNLTLDELPISLNEREILSSCLANSVLGVLIAIMPADSLDVLEPGSLFLLQHNNRRQK
jgi:HTH-type transcriptional regulator/antitoxin HigA